MTPDTIRSFDRIEHILSELTFFEQFSHDEIFNFANQLSLRSFPTQSVLFEEGDIGDYLFFIVSGQIEVRLESHSNTNLVLARFGPSSSIGEMSLIDDYPRSATIIVSKPSELLILSRKRLDTICEDNPRTGLKFMKGLAKTLSSRLRKSNGRFVDIA